MHHPLDVSLFITDVFASIGRGNGVTTVATPFPSQSSPIPVRSTVAALPVNDDERKSGHMLAGDNLDHRGSPMATSAERMAATRARRRAGLVRFVVDAADRRAVRLGYEGVTADEPRAAGEALRLFISDTIACTDTEDHVPKV